MGGSELVPSTTVGRLEEARRKGRAAWAQTFQPVLGELRDRIRERGAVEVAAAAGASWDSRAGELHLTCLGDAVRVSWPELVAYPEAAVGPSTGGSTESPQASGASGSGTSVDVQPCRADLQGLILYYLALADGTPLIQHWIAFRELPDGWLYHQAFQGYTGDELVRTWGNDLEAFVAAASRLGGRPLDGSGTSLGDAAFAFDLLPRVAVAVVYWAGDEEFPPHAQVLFDAAASHYLTTDGLAVLGHHLMHRLVE